MFSLVHSQNVFIPDSPTAQWVHTHLLFYSEEPYNIVVVKFTQDIKLAHLYRVRSHVTHLIEHLHGVEVTCFLKHTNL